MSLVTTVLAEAEHTLPMIAPTWVFGVIALVVFASLAFVVFSYRDVANRHRRGAPGAAQHAQSAGATHHGAGHPHELGH